VDLEHRLVLTGQLELDGIAVVFGPHPFLEAWLSFDPGG